MKNKNFKNIYELQEELYRLQEAYEVLERIYMSIGPYNEPYNDRLGNVMAIDPNIAIKLNDFFGFDDNE